MNLRRFLALLLIITLFGTIPPRAAHLQAPPPPPPQSYPVRPLGPGLPPAMPCYDGLMPPPTALCLVIPVEEPRGNRQKGRPVTVSYGDRSITTYTRDIASFPGQSPMAAVDVSRLGAGLTDLVLVETQQAGPKLSRLVAIAPDPETRTQIIDPLVAGDVGDLNQGLIWGTVALLDDQKPLAGARVTLSLGATVLATTDTITGASGVPTFDFNPAAQAIKHGDVLSITAATDTYSDTVAFAWDGQQTFVPVILGWDCSGAIIRNRGIGDIPINFCLSGRVTLNGAAVSEAAVDIRVGSTAISSTTTLVKDLGIVGFVEEIGWLAEIYPEDTAITISATADGYVGGLVRTFRELGVRKRWGQRIDIPLIADRTPAAGLWGGSITALAMAPAGAGQKTYFSTSHGGVSVAFGPGQPVRYIGNGNLSLSTPEVTALLWLGGAYPNEYVLAGNRAGQLQLSSRGGVTWGPAETLASGAPVSALARLDATTVAVASGSAFYTYTLGLSGTATLQRRGQYQPPFEPRGLAAGSRLYAAAADGLWASDDRGVTWSRLRAEAASAVAVLEGAPERVLVGTAAGVFSTDADGVGWERAGLAEPVLGLDARGVTVQASTASGIMSATATGGWNWQPLVVSRPAAAEQPTPGTPSTFDLVAVAPVTNTVPPQPGYYLAATATGVFSSTSGYQWQMTAPLSGTAALRSLALEPDGAILAISADGLARWKDGRWRAVPLPGGYVNGSVVRSLGTVRLVGRNAGADGVLNISTDGGASWAVYHLGDDRGVTDISFISVSGGRPYAIIATDGDGLFAWDSNAPTTLRQLAAAGLNAGERISALAQVKDRTNCQLVLATYAPVRILSADCAEDPAWSAATALAGASLVTGLAGQPNRIFAATDSGIFQGSLSSAWQVVFGIPLRPLALSDSTNPLEKRIMLAGGVEGGVVVLNDSAPDVGVRIIGPATVRGETTVDYTVELQNYGTIVARQTSLDFTATPGVFSQIEFLDSRWPTFDVLPGAPITATVRITIPANARPTQAVLAVKAKTDASERFAGNNEHKLELSVGYRSGADPFVQIGGATMVRPGITATLRLTTGNLGNLSSAPFTVRLALPPGVEVAAAAVKPTPTITAGGLEWSYDSLEKTSKREILVPYRLSAALAPSTTLPISAEIRQLGDNRELNNDVDEATLRFVPAQPQLVVVTNWTRQLDLGPLGDARIQANDFIKRENALEIALDGEECLSEQKTPLPCQYAAWDAALTALNKLSEQATASQRETALEHAIEERNLLVKAIVAYIRKEIGSLKPRAIYLLGGDTVIPFAARPDIDDKDYQHLASEYEVADRVPANDSLSGVLLANHYITDWDYRLGATYLQVGRSTGSSAAIAAVLKTYLANDGTIAPGQAFAVGVADELTENTQQASCKLMLERLRIVSPNDACATINPSARTALELAQQPDTATENKQDSIGSISGHAWPSGIDDLSSTAVLTASLDTLNLLILLGCQSGLAPTPLPGATPSLAEAFGRQGIPFFAHTGLAYASVGDAKQNSLELPPTFFAERLHFLLLKHLMRGNISLGEAYQAAISEYAPSTDISAMNRKTRETLILYGPPTYKLDLGGALQSRSRAAAQAVPPGDLVITATYAARATDYGTLYEASSSQGEMTFLGEHGRTIQPAIRIAVPADTTHVVVYHEKTHSISAVDPVVLRVAPLSAPAIYGEPQYAGPPKDWDGYHQLATDEFGQKWLTIGLGSWSPDGTQQLTDSVRVKIKR